MSDTTRVDKARKALINANRGSHADSVLLHDGRHLVIPEAEIDELIAAVLERAHFADLLAEPQHGNCGVIQQNAARMKPVEAAREDVLNNAQGLLESNPSTQRAAWEQMVVALDALIAEATREDQS